MSATAIPRLWILESMIPRSCVCRVVVIPPETRRMEIDDLSRLLTSRSDRLSGPLLWSHPRIPFSRISGHHNNNNNNCERQELEKIPIMSGNTDYNEKHSRCPSAMSHWKGNLGYGLTVPADHHHC